MSREHGGSADPNRRSTPTPQFTGGTISVSDTHPICILCDKRVTEDDWAPAPSPSTAEGNSTARGARNIAIYEGQIVHLACAREAWMKRKGNQEEDLTWKA